MNSTLSHSHYIPQTPTLALRIFFREKDELKILKKRGKLHKFTDLTLQFDRDRSKFGNSYQWETAKTKVMRSLSHLSVTRKIKRFIYYHEKQRLANGTEFLYIAQTIKKMNCVRYVNINLEGASVLNQHVNQCIFKPLANLGKLNSMSLNFCENYEMTDAGIATLSRNFKKIKNLETIYLNLLGCKINGTGISSMLNNIRRNSLTKLKVQAGPLEFPHYSAFTDAGLISASKSLTKMQKLTSLDFSILWCHKVTDKGMAHFASCLPLIPCLSNISFQMSRCIVTDNSALEFSRNLAKLYNLRVIYFSARECARITNKGVTSIFKALENLKNLKECHLDFDRSNFNDEGLNELSLALQKFRHINSFSLSIDRCEVISDEGLIELAEGIKHMNLLKKLSLNFRDCRGISDKGVLAIGAAIPGLPNLKIVEINLRWCENIKQETVDLVEQELSRNTKLESFAIYHPMDVVKIE